MKNTTLQLIAVVLFALGTVVTNAQADLVLADDFSATSVSTTTDGFRIRENSIDNGWQAARQGGGSDWSTTGGTLNNDSTVNTPGYPNYIPGESPVAQSLSTAGLGLSGSNTMLEISFDYSVAANDTLYLNFWGHTGAFDSASSNIVANLESRLGLANNEGSTTLDAFNLLDGATTGFGTGNPFASFAGGALGMSGSFSATVDLATLGIAGVSNVADFSVLTLAFAKEEDGTAGTTSIGSLRIDATAVPEPSSAVLLGLAGLGFVGRRRRS